MLILLNSLEVNLLLLSGEGIKQLIVHHTGQYKINKGEELYLRFKRDSVHLFEENGMSVSKKNN